MTLYLIAHKVRGEPAFDIATKMPMHDGDWWIIPTSGHRAYPYWYIEIGDPEYSDNDIWQVPPMPADLRDHYELPQKSPARDYTDRATSDRKAIPTLEDI